MAKHIKADGMEAVVKPANGKKKFTLKELQAFVGGFIELTITRDRKVMYVNEKGLLKELPVNDKASKLIDPAYWTVGGVRGDVVVLEKGEA